MTKFLIHPSDLQQRRKRCETEAQRLLHLQRETVISCNVCSSPRHAVVTSRDRYGLPFRNALCLDCGLLYLVDRFTFAGYSEFYSSGAYRTVSCQFNGVTHTIAQVQADQVSYAKILTRVLSGLVPRRREGKLLDVGGSAGIIAREFVKEFGLQGTVLDPATDEVAAARAAGLEAVVGSVEDWQTNDKFDLILLCRSIEHMFDLRLAMTRIRSLLKPDGLFYVDIADFMEMSRMVGAPETFTKVDHCYWLTQSTALDIFRAVGFELVSMNIVSGGGYVGFLLRPCELAAPGLSAANRVQQQIEEIQKIEREWTWFGGTFLGPTDWLRRKAYRVKRRALGLVRSFTRKSRVRPSSTGVEVLGTFRG
jgi:SAM-dependent methyltransferase